jgi:uncharacterized membrane protein YkvA (DUF1232 family)
VNSEKYAEQTTTGRTIMSQSTSTSDFFAAYSDDGFWLKVGQYAKDAGSEVIEKALWLFYAAQRDEVPVKAKAVIYSALGYFILPTDAIPDLIPVVGYADDLGALALAVATVAAYVDPDVKRLARKKMDDWFGDPEVPSTLPSV